LPVDSSGTFAHVERADEPAFGAALAEHPWRRRRHRRVRDRLGFAGPAPYDRGLMAHSGRATSGPRIDRNLALEPGPGHRGSGRWAAARHMGRNQKELPTRPLGFDAPEPRGSSTWTVSWSSARARRTRPRCSTSASRSATATRRGRRRRRPDRRHPAGGPRHPRRHRDGRARRAGLHVPHPSPLHGEADRRPGRRQGDRHHGPGGAQTSNGSPGRRIAASRT